MSDNLNELKEQAKDLFKSKDFGDLAVSVNQQILKLDPLENAAYARLGKIFFEQGSLDNAIMMYEKLLEIDPENKIAKKGLILCKNYFGDSETTAKLKEVKTFNEAFSKATAFKDKKNYLAAISAYRRTLELTDNQKDIMIVKTGLAAAYSYAGLHSVSENMYRELLSVEPGNNIIRVGLAGALNSLGKYVEAENLCKVVLKEQPNNKFAKMCLASVKINKSSK